MFYFYIYISCYACDDILHFKNWVVFILSFYFRITEEVGNDGEKNLGDEKPVAEAAADGIKENPDNKLEEKEPQEKVKSLSSH